MKLVLGTFDDVASARACEVELRRAGYTRVHLIDTADTMVTHGLPRDAIQRHRDDLERGGCLLVVRCEPSDVPAVRLMLEAGMTSRVFEARPVSGAEAVQGPDVDIGENITPLRQDRATRFGYDLADDPAFRDRDWPVVERDARARWARNNDLANWEAAKARVRLAFESRRAEQRRLSP